MATNKDDLLNRYINLETDLMGNIIESITKIDDFNDPNELTTAEIRFKQQNKALVVRNSISSAPILYSSIKQVGIEGARKHEQLMSRAFNQRLLPIMTEPYNIADSIGVNQVINQKYNRLKDSFNIVNTTIYNNANKTYHDIIGSTAARMQAGELTRQQAAKLAVKELVDKGLPAFVDRAGRQWQMDSYVNMVLTTMRTQTAAETQFARLSDWGGDLIEVSSHVGARPKCAQDQGKIYSISGKSGTVETAEGILIQYYSFADTSYGQIDGLFGINCGHNQYPFIPGLSNQTFEPYNYSKNDKIYEESQQQRRIEREIRKAKREEVLFDKAGDREAQAQAHQKVLNQQARMREFIDYTGRTRRTGREQII